ncbi:phosphoenolpyruvate carboxykinase (ATP), partial [Sphingopyxis sp.]|uniref:phosphoenolpyruvate carboxykinase (ATP) n=1 Tax=Sphingopyxis sp. TaxID=1908224 RepID=UPI002B495E8B
MTKIVFGRDSIETKAEVAENWGTSALIEDAVRHNEGRLAKDGPLVVQTGKHTGRSAKDKFIVQDAETADTIWWGKTNVPMTPNHFAALKADFLAHLAERPRLYRQQL